MEAQSGRILDGLVNFCPLLDYVAEITAPGTFMLLDIGCSGGINRQWRRLGRRLRAIGIDPDVREIERLAAREKNPLITYVNAFAGIAPDHPFAIKKQGKPDLERNPWPRLSTLRYMENVYPPDKKISDKERRSANLWPTAQLADPSSPIIVPEHLRHNGVSSLDFLKIDVDGKDFDLLNAFDQALTDLAVLGVGIEVRFWGSACETDGTFHNVDRFLKARGFELFNLTLRRYSTSALPSQFVGRAPGPTESGRVHHGDAMYARDLGSGLHDDFANSLTADKILNLAAIFAIFDLPDCAAEIVLKFRHLLSQLCDVDRILDLLTTQAEKEVFGIASYNQRMERFLRQPGRFRRTRNPFLRLARAWKRGYLKWRGRMQLRKLERRGI